jgi:hypothetical protein
MNASVTLIPPYVWPILFPLGALLAYAEITHSQRVYRAIWALALFTAFIIGFLLV